MEMPPATPPSSGSSTSGEPGALPERPTYATPPQDSLRTRETESLDAPLANTAVETTGMSETSRGEPPTKQRADEAGDAPVTPTSAPTLRPFTPPPPPPLRYGEPRPAITPNRIGDPIRTSEPGTESRPVSDPTSTTRVAPTPAPTLPPAPETPSQPSHPNAYAPPVGSAPVGTPLSSAPMQPQPQTSQPPQQQTTQWSSPQPLPTQPQSAVDTAASTYYPYPPQPSAPQASPPPTSQPARPYGGTSSYAPPASVSPASAYPAGYAPANTLAPAVPVARSAGTNNGLLAVIAVLLAIIALFQIINAFRPLRFDGAQPVQVQTKPLSQSTRDQVKDTLDKAQKAITDVNTQATQDYNAATTDTQRQAILAKYSFTLQQIIAQQENDMLRIMQEQNTP